MHAPSTPEPLTPNADGQATPHDGIDRRGLLKCMAWAGTGLLWSLDGGVAQAQGIEPAGGAPAGGAGLYFVQVSDSHIGFNKAANPDVAQTLRAAVAKINALPRRPDFVVHTGDVSHLSRPDQFDLADQVLKGIRTERIVYVPGEHDVIGDNGRQFFERYGHAPQGWYSFDLKGVHFIALVNVLNFKDRGLGQLGPAQLEWLERDVRGLSSSTPIVVFAHMPLWAIYPEWGWGTADSAQALAQLKRFGSLTVLNGHIHQVLQKVEGHASFHTALSTAYPQPAPGVGPGPGPLAVPAPQLSRMLGIRGVSYSASGEAPRIVDTALADAPGGAAVQVGIDQFKFAPERLEIVAGTTVTWVNRDGEPHTVTSTDQRFQSSAALDTDDRFSHTFTEPGRYAYVCSIHPFMRGVVTVSASAK